MELWSGSLGGVGDAEAEVLRIDQAPGLGGGLLDALPGRPASAGDMRRSQPAVGQPAGALQGRGPATAEPHLQRLLSGTLGDGHVVEVVPLARRR